MYLYRLYLAGEQVEHVVELAIRVSCYQAVVSCPLAKAVVEMES